MVPVGVMDSLALAVRNSGGVRRDAILLTCSRLGRRIGRTHHGTCQCTVPRAGQCSSRYCRYGMIKARVFGSDTSSTRGTARRRMARRKGQSFQEG